MPARSKRCARSSANSASCTAACTWRSSWLLALASDQGIVELPAFSTAQIAKLKAIAADFSVDDGARIKTIEATTNHDVKAVEYFIKERIGNDESLAQAKEFVHFACTSEDINNLSYALMLRDAREQVLLPAFDGIIAKLRELSRAQRRAADAVAHARPDRFADYLGQGNGQRGCAPGAPAQADSPRVEVPGKINGAVGNYNAHAITYPECRLARVSRNASWNARPRLERLHHPDRTA